MPLRPFVRTRLLPPEIPEDPLVWHQILVEWNEPRPEHAGEGLVADLLAARAEQQPGAAALIAGDDRISYGGLEARATALAAGLRRLGVGPEVVVGVLLERSPDMVAALLAVWKCGGAYLPLDPEHPADRMAFFLEDGLRGPGPRLVLTQRRLAARIPAGTGVRLVCVDEAPGPVAVREEPAPCRPPLPDHPAYVIYTSGSTGRPKGIVISHRSLANRLLWACAAEVGADAVFLHKTTLTFDVSLAEIFAPLLAGGRCVLTRPGGQRDPAYLADLIQREGITHASFPPATLKLLLDLPGVGEKLRSLRVLVTGGETVPPDLPRRVGELLPATTLYNRYGPTETTISVLTGACDPRSEEDTVPLGRPIGRARLYVLGDDLRPRPAMADGEIYIGGPGVARGYLGRPDLTAASFVPDPFGGPGERLYRTGDRARWRPDGTVEFLGRLDHQIKIRGFRVELEEIEAVLVEHPRVREAAVVPQQEAATGSCRLIACLVAAEGERVDGGELRRFLGDRLAGYMVPAAFVAMAALPRTLSGKIDRAALREIALRGPGAPALPTEPRDGLEATLAALFRELLEIPGLGTEESLFDLGGHSLLLVGLQTRLRSALAIEVELADLARNPSVGSLARFLAAGARGSEITPGQLAADAVLAPEIRPVPDGETALKPPVTVLLTGATGFLGAHLLEQLLAQTWARVICLVRAPGEVAAREAVRRALERYGLWREERARRISAVPGDLGRPFLGLPEAAFHELAATVDAVYHCGAQVNLLYPYETLRAANVDGTREVLRFAAAGRAKEVHHVSSLSVLERRPLPRSGAVAEAPLAGGGEGLAGGYRQSKWVAEKLVEEARGRGIPAVVYRPGWITGHTATGIANPDDFLGRLIVASIRLGAAPDLGPIEVCPTPVDYVSAAIVWLSLRRAPGEVYHLINPHPVAFDRLVDLVNELGHPVEMLPLDRWAAELAAFAEGDGRELLAPLAGFLRRLDAGGPPLWRPLRFDSTRTREALAAGPVACPAVDRRLVESYLASLAEAGRIPPADRAELRRSVR
jgi:amino acid adenylation domain-containing protein/thioester reductase-like protein